MAEGRVAGTLYLRIDGVQYTVKGSVKFKLGGAEREPLEDTLSPYTGAYKEMSKAGVISATLQDSGGLSVDALNNIRDASVQLELASGKRYTWPRMTSRGGIEPDAGEGELELQLFGAPGKEKTV